MEIPLRAALIGWLASDTTLATSLNAVTEEAPLRAQLPWLSIIDSASVDYSTKTETGWEARIALELRTRGDVPGSNAALVSATQSRVLSLPRVQTGFRIASIGLLRSSVEQQADKTRVMKFEYRFRLFAA